VSSVLIRYDTPVCAARRSRCDDGAVYDFMTRPRGAQLVVRPGDIDQVVEYGLYIPTPVHLLEEGHFE